MRCSVFFLHFISQPNHSVFFALSVFGLSLFGFPMNASFWCTVYSCVSRDVCLLIFFFFCFILHNVFLGKQQERIDTSAVLFFFLSLILLYRILKWDFGTAMGSFDVYFLQSNGKGATQLFHGGAGLICWLRNWLVATTINKKWLNMKC